MKTILFCLISMLGVSPAVAQLTLQDSLVLYFPFDGNVLDSSGNANHGMLNGATFTTGQSGSAVFLDGMNDFISIPNTQKMDAPLPVTIASWVKIEDYDPNLVFWNDWEEDVYNGAWLNIVNGIISAAYGDGGAIGPQSRRSKRGISAIPLQTWTHVAVVIRGATDMDIYVNGRNDCGTYNGSGGGISYSGNPGRIGQIDPFAASGTIFDFFHGAIDELRYYNRALEESEIALLAQVSPLTTVVDSICVGGSVTLVAPAGYAGYNWSPSTGLSCTACPSPVASPTVNSQFEVLLTKAAGCVDTLVFDIQVDSCCNGSLTAIFENLQAPRCPTDSLQSFFVYASNGTAPYQYSINGATYFPSGNFDNLSPGVYTVSVLDSLGCEFDTTIMLASPPPPIQLSFVTTGETAYGTNDGSAKVTPIGGNGPVWTYSWSNGVSTDSITGLAPGTYTVIVSDAFGCIQIDSVEVRGVGLSIRDKAPYSLFQVSPNPSFGDFVLTKNSPYPLEIHISDIHGREIYSYIMGSSETEVNIQLSLETGFYILSGAIENEIYFRVISVVSQ